jgi:hypothetical protein
LNQLSPSREDDVGLILTPTFDQSGDELGRVLQVGIDDNDRIPTTMIEPRSQRNFLTEIPAQIDDRDAGIKFTQRSQDRKSIVPAPIIDLYDLAPLRQTRSYIR